MGMMRRALSPLLDLLYQRLVRAHYAKDLLLELQLEAKRESIDYVQAHMRGAMVLGSREALHRLALERAAAADAPADGLYIELGVKKGASLRAIAAMTDRVVHGFDSFRGLPEDWSGTSLRRGKFSTGGRMPRVPRNVRLHAGWFEDSLPPFAAEHSGPIAFMHVDCDLYSSTRTAFEVLGDRIVAGTVLVFDEYFNYPNWREHEHRAFQELVTARGIAYEYLAFLGRGGSVALRVTTVGGEAGRGA